MTVFTSRFRQAHIRRRGKRKVIFASVVLTLMILATGITCSSHDDFGVAEIKDMQAKAETRQARETERAMMSLYGWDK